MKIVKSEVRNINLEPYVHMIQRKDHKHIFLNPPGKDHYSLLAYFSIFLEGDIIIELGTHSGTSSTALAINPYKQITTYDVKNQYDVSPQPKNVTRMIGNIFDLGNAHQLLNADLIFLDTSHTGEFEKKVYDYLVKNNYKGLLLLDDIHWSDDMTSFWEYITTDKYDITDIGHGDGQGPNGNISGTGIVDFTGELQIID